MLFFERFSGDCFTGVEMPVKGQKKSKNVKTRKCTEKIPSKYTVVEKSFGVIPEMQIERRKS